MPGMSGAGYQQTMGQWPILGRAVLDAHDAVQPWRLAVLGRAGPPECRAQVWQLPPAGRCGTVRLTGRLIALDGPRLDDPAAMVRAMAVWALSEPLDRQAVTRRRARHLEREPDPAVRREWTEPS